MLAAMFDAVRAVTQDSQKTEREQIIEQIEFVKKQIALIDELFNMSEDTYLIEACIYQSKAFWAYYNYLLGLVKTLPEPETAADLKPDTVSTKLREALRPSW